ncbi:hypothetical protein [Streptomyces ipomoeae]|uniref:hypothetical protein n=1 Tax=Streptomyces ipomoeae TaxID=103232 RepID=UPI0029B16E9D|nr:hypothetical protein [Streptomyces ipomoeae]MDX2696837.1 hypothetical protein [Streptomyces ipomoeae]MDX2843173.1 hypothetical protein [Streptomyces ipomoeae]
MTPTLNPGSGPVADATEEQATANMQAFVEELAARYDVNVVSFVRAATSDYGQGRWAYELLTNDERRLTVQMPGAALDTVREGGLRLYIDDSSWAWDYALDSCRPSQEQW